MEKNAFSESLMEKNAFSESVMERMPSLKV